MPTSQPGVAKRGAGATGGGTFAIIVVWLLGEIWAIEIPAEIAVAFGAAFSIVGNWVMRRFGT